MEHNAVTAIFRDKGYGALTFGFDIGIASVGWAVLNETRIVDLGVRCFDAAEDPKEKISLNQARRIARTSRNRNAQRHSRLKRLSSLFVDVDLVTAEVAKKLFAGNQPNGISTVDIWQLRSEALNRILDGNEFARILHHLVKWRGYSSLRDAKDRAETDQEGIDTEFSAGFATDNTESAAGASMVSPNDSRKKLGFSTALDKTSKLMDRLLEKYHTVGNLVYTLASSTFIPSQDEREAAALYRKAKRNHADGYERSHLRKYLRQEIVTIFAKQRLFGSAHVNTIVRTGAAAIEEVTVGTERFPVDRSFEQQVLALFDEQFPPIAAAQLAQLVGRCALEKDEPRAPKESFSAERSRWLQTLNKLKVKVQSDPLGERFLNAREHLALVNLPYLKAEITYADIRDALCENAGWPRDWRLASFSSVSYRSVATPQSDQITVVQIDGEKIKLMDAVVIHLPKADRKGRLKAKKELKEWLEVESIKGTLTFKNLRAYLDLQGNQRFSMLRKRHTIVLPDAEGELNIPISGDVEDPLQAGFFIKTRAANEKSSRYLPSQAFNLLKQWSLENCKKTLANLRCAVDAQNWPAGIWQFIVEEKQVIEPTDSAEVDTKIELAYTDAQAIEKETRFERLRGWHKLKKAMASTDAPLWSELQTAWTTPLSAAGIAARNSIDSIFDALALCFTDKEVETALNKLQPSLSPATVISLRDTVSSGFAHLSYLALRTIQPQLEECKIYSEACRLSIKGYDHSGSRTVRQAKIYLPKLDSFLFKRISVKTNEVKKKLLPDGTQTDVVEKRYKDLANPVVARSFNQARNVLNALIQKYGSPAYVSVELARDLSKPGDLRKKIESVNKEKEKLKDADRANLSKSYEGLKVSAALMRKIRMREEQGCKCIYSGKPIHFEQMLRDENYVQSDHVIPLSRSGDNSLNNQVLVLAGENQRKGNRTPFEWMGRTDTSWWHSFKVTVLSLPLMSNKKKQQLLLEEFDENEFTANNLVDTRYTTQLFARVVREGLVFHKGVLANDESSNQEDIGPIKLDRFMRARVRTPQGGMTSMLRGLWGLSKNRVAGDLHHAADACVIAAATPKLIQRINQYHRFKEQVIITANGVPVWRESDTKALGEILTADEFKAFVEKEFPQPFHPHMFHQEVMARLSRDAQTYMTKRGEHKHYDFKNYSEAEQKIIGPVTVSRLVERYKSNNELHDSNPKALRNVSILLKHLTPELLTINRYPKQFAKQHAYVFQILENLITKSSGDAKVAFADGSIQIGTSKPIQSIRIPWLYLTDQEKITHAKSIGLKPKNIKGAYKSVPLTKLTLDMLNEATLGREIWLRDQLLINALRTELSKPRAKSSEIFANGFAKPVSKKASERRANLGITNFVPPLVKSLRIPDNNDSGFIVRGGIVGQGAAISVLVTRDLKSNRFEFTSKYAAKQVFQLPRPTLANLEEKAMLFELLPNCFVAIEHPNLNYCFAETRRHFDASGVEVIDIEPLFPDGIFYGCYKFYEPSNDRPVLELHDRSPFFLLSADCHVDLKPLQLIKRVKTNKRKNSIEINDEILQYVLKSDLNLPKPRTFELTTTVKRKISDAKAFDLLKVNNLGRWVFRQKD